MAIKWLRRIILSKNSSPLGDVTAAPHIRYHFSFGTLEVKWYQRDPLWPRKGRRRGTTRLPNTGSCSRGNDGRQIYGNVVAFLQAERGGMNIKSYCSIHYYKVSIMTWDDTSDYCTPAPSQEFENTLLILKMKQILFSPRQSQFNL